MKSLYLILFFISFLAGCKLEVPDTDTSNITVVSGTIVQQEGLKLAWGSNYPEWDKALIDAVNSSDLKDTVKKPCKKLSSKQCLVHALASMAKPESDFDPKSFMYECNKKKNVYGEDVFLDKTRGWCMKGSAKYENGYVVSRGLLQISIGSAKSYGCPIENPMDLHDPSINLECAERIAVKWINQDGVFYGYDPIKKKHLGLARYWHAMRDSSSSQNKIISDLEKL